MVVKGGADLRMCTIFSLSRPAACTSREEAVESRARWFPYNKGGEFRKWYGNQEHVVNWEGDGREISDFKPRSVIRNPNTYFSSSVSWSDIGSGDAAFRRYPNGFIHDVKGMSAFGSEAVMNRVVTLMNSSFARAVLRAVAPTVNFQIGDVGKVPIIGFQEKPSKTADLLVNSKQDWDASEISREFNVNPLVEK